MFKSYKSVSATSVFLVALLSACGSQADQQVESTAQASAVTPINQQTNSADDVDSASVDAWVTKAGGEIDAARQITYFEKIELFTQKQDYEKVLSRLHAFEPLPEPLANWLAEKAEQGHVMLQYEYAKHLVSIDPLESATWFNIAFIGSKIDSNLCAARDAHNAYLKMSRKNQTFAQPILQNHPEVLLPAMDSAISWHEKNKDARPMPHWICYRAVNVYQDDIVVYKRDHWPAVWDAIMKEIRASHEKNKLQEQSSSLSESG